MEAAASLDYRPDPNASRLAAGTTGSVGVLVPRVDGWRHTRLLAGVESTLTSTDHDVVLRSAVRDNPMAVVEAVRAMRNRVDGLLLVDVHLTDDEVEVLGDVGLPVVMVGTGAAGFDAVTVDDRGGAAGVAHHLAGLGHRRIAFVDLDPDEVIPHGAAFERRSGFRAGLAQRGIEAVVELGGEGSAAGGAAALARLLAVPYRPTAVFAAGDEMALGLLLAARRHGLDVPGDLSVVGFDGHELAGAAGLTTVAVDLVEVGVIAARRVIDRVGIDALPAHEVVAAELVVRESTARPGSGHWSMADRR